MRLPNLVPVPGVKLGLANIVTVFAVYHYRAGEAAMIVFCRVVLGAFFGGSMLTLLYSLAGALLCLCSVGVLVWQLAAQPRAAVLIAVTVCMLLLPFVWQALYRLGRRGAQR